MQFRLVPAALIFLGSYLPLSLILLAQNYDYTRLGEAACWPLSEPHCSLPFKTPTFAFASVGVSAVCLAITLLTLARATPKQEIVIKEARYIPTELMNYTLPYVVSFMSIEYQDMTKFSGLAIFLFWMFWITYKSGQILFNPILIVFGWRLYDIGYCFAGSDALLTSKALTKGSITANERHRQIGIQNVLVIKDDAIIED